MPSNPKASLKSKAINSDAKTLTLALPMSDDDDDFQNPNQAISMTQNLILSSLRNPRSQPLKPSNGARSRKKPKHEAAIGKENRRTPQTLGFDSRVSVVCEKNKVVRSQRENLSAPNGSRSVEKNSPTPVSESWVFSECGERNSIVLEKGNPVTPVESKVDVEFNESNRAKEENLCVLTSVESTLVEEQRTQELEFRISKDCGDNRGLTVEKGSYYTMSIESRLLESRTKSVSIVGGSCPEGDGCLDFEPGTQLNVLMNLCSEIGDERNSGGGVISFMGNAFSVEESAMQKNCLVECPLCGNDITDLSEELRQVHTNDCLDSDGISEIPLVPMESSVLVECNKRKEENMCSLTSAGSKLLEELLSHEADFTISKGYGESMGLEEEKGNCYSLSIESRLLDTGTRSVSKAEGFCFEGDGVEDFLSDPQPGVSMNLSSEMGKEDSSNGGVSFIEGNGSSVQTSRVQRNVLVECPLCGLDITNLNEELQQVHTNDCLDRDGNSEVTVSSVEIKSISPRQAVDVTPVLEWLRTLGLSKYEEVFIREEIDWETLQWLTEEDLLSIGVLTLGPRKKIVHALNEIRQRNDCAQHLEKDASNMTTNENTKLSTPGNKLITEYFRGPSVDKNRASSLSKAVHVIKKNDKVASRRRISATSNIGRGKLRDIPLWCCIPGTPFRVDAFRYLRGDCSHWFLTHFHIDHYQGLTRNFSHGKIYCSSITAHLVNMKIGVPWDKLHILPLNQKITVSGVNLTCLDANHCPGSIIILFEPPSGKAVLHTGDFRFSADMASISVLQSCHVHTLILDTTYCNPQYDFPKQEAVIQFVIEAIQAEAFNPKTLFLIGSYTIGKERLFLEVARLLKKKVYVGAAKLRLLRCLELPEEDMQWFTANEMESHIHVVPMWTIASFKRMKFISNQYSDRFNLIVAFSPTGWTFGKGKKKTPGRRWQQGTIIRYEVPYSEHSSFTELREFVQFLSPDIIIPSVNNDGPESADAMIALLMS